MAKTAKQLIREVRQNLYELDKIRYNEGTTTSAGATTGLTLIDSSLSSFVDDYFVGAFVEITSGTFVNSGLSLITDFVSTTGTVTIDADLGGQIGSGVTYRITEQGIYTDSYILQLLNNALNSLPLWLSDYHLKVAQKKAVTTGVSGVTTIPEDLIYHFRIDVNDRRASVLENNQYKKFREDPFLFDSNNPVVIFTGETSVDSNNQFGRLEYRPDNNVNIQWYYLPRLSDVNESSNIQLPTYLDYLITLDATQRALEASEDFDNAQVYEKQKTEQIQLINNKTV